MPKLNQFQVIGSLAETPAITTGNNGKSQCKFTINVESGVWNRETKKEEEAYCPMNFFVSGAYAEALSKAVKGGMVFLMGKFSPREYKDKQYVNYDVKEVAVIY